MELVLAILCDQAVERPDGKLDIAGVLTDLSAPGFPAQQPRMTLVLVMEWSEAELGAQAFRADLVDDADRRVLTIEGETEVAGTAGVPQRTRLILPLERVVFPHAGRYRLQLVAGGDVREACSLFVRSSPAETAAR
jgi:hypothetical protein